MCAICQNGPAVLAGVPAAGLVLARIRRALSRPPEETGAAETTTEEDAP
jgi:hypothetical protein